MSKIETQKIGCALTVIERFGSFEELHHKQWVLDQVVQELLGPELYKDWVKDRNSDTSHEPWDVGIAP